MQGKNRRVGNTELPDAHEVLEMIRLVESSRVAEDRSLVDRYLESGIFDSFRELSRQAGVGDIFDIDRNIGGVSAFHEAIQRLHLAAEAMVRALTDRRFDTDLTNGIFDSLSEQDEPEAANAIFVFGAPSNARIEKAVELYKMGFSDRLFISGRGPNWGVGEVIAEAERMADFAIQAGVPTDRIIVEPVAVSIPDNVKRTLDLFDETEFWPQKLIIVSSMHTLLRSTIDWLKFSRRPLSVVRVAPPLVNPGLGREQWAHNDFGRRLVVNEYAKIVNEAIIDELVASDEGRAILESRP